MGLIKAALGSAGGVLADQWKEYFYCDALPSTVLTSAECTLVQVEEAATLTLANQWEVLP